MAEKDSILGAHHMYSLERGMTYLKMVLITLFASVIQSAYGAPEPILDKQSAVQMFMLSPMQWKDNVTNLKQMGVGDFSETSNSGATLIYRPDPQGGLLFVTPSYKSISDPRPFKIDVVVQFDQMSDRKIFESLSFGDIKSLIEETAKSMRPEFSVMGYLSRGDGNPPKINFIIFQNGEFPPVDQMVDLGKVCPPKNNKQMCVIEGMLGDRNNEEELFKRCTSQMRATIHKLGKTEAELSDLCQCISQMGKMGKSFEETTTECLN